MRTRAAQLAAGMAETTASAGPATAMPNLILNGPDPVDVVDARVRLLVQTLLGALGGKPDPAALIV